jgi:large subunit ribosomal protein L30e
MELPAAIKRIMETGKVELGTNSTLSGISDGKVRLVVLASNCPKAAKRDIERYAGLGSVPVVTFDGTALQLGELCGKPFVVAALGVTDPGAVSINEIAKGTR